MALDDFRRTDLIIDKATQRIDWQAPLRAVQGEYNGRSLRVQLTNGGVVEPQTASLLFGFHCTANHKEGVYDMTVVDAEKGLYEVFYPSDMLEKAGTVACTIKIIENTGSGADESHIAILDGISVEVAYNPVSGEAEVAENSIRVFDKALIDIAAHERRILIMEMNFTELSEMLTLNIPNMDMAVSKVYQAVGFAADEIKAAMRRDLVVSSAGRLLAYIMEDAGSFAVQSNLYFGTDLDASIESLSELADSAPQMQKALKNRYFCTALAASDTAIKKVASSSTAMREVIASETALQEICASEMALQAIAASRPAMREIAMSSEMLAKIKASAKLRDIVKSSPLVRNKTTESYPFYVGYDSDEAKKAIIPKRALIIRAGTTSNSSSNRVVMGELIAGTVGQYTEKTLHTVDLFATFDNFWLGAEPDYQYKASRVVTYIPLDEEV